MRREIVLDTSWLLELYRVPGHFHDSTSKEAINETLASIESGCAIWVTVPVVFEVANHISHVKDGTRRRQLSRQLFEDVKSSNELGMPWTIYTVDKGILLRSSDIVALADRFLRESGPNYSFADISIIDLASELRNRDCKVKILTLDESLRAYSD